MADSHYISSLPYYGGSSNPTSRPVLYAIVDSSDFGDHKKAQKDGPDSTKDEFTLDFIKEHPQVKEPILQLQQLHVLQQDIFQRLQQDIHDLEKKYNSRYQELYRQRAAIINASAPRNIQKPRQASNGRGIPSFWLKAMENNSAIDEVITKEDKAALEFLKDIQVEYLDRPGFVLHFEFGENPFFDNKVLKKTYTYEREKDHFAGDLVYGEAIGDEIHWKEGKDLTIKTFVVDGVVQGSIEVDSFFNFFDTSNDDDDDDDDDDNDDDEDNREGGGGDDDDDDDEDEEWDLENDFELGEKFKDDLIPYALYWYTGEAALYEEDDEDEDEDDGGDDGDGDGDDE